MKHSDQNVYNEIFNINQYEKTVKVTNNNLILDLGCSKGYFFVKQIVNNNTNVDYIGLDPSIFNIGDFIDNLIEYNELINSNRLFTLLNLAISDKVEIINFGCMFHLNCYNLVPTITFVDLLKLINRKIDFLKFDIEGFEKYIFERQDLFKSHIHKFSGELHFKSETFPREDVYKLLDNFREDPDINFNLFALNDVDITESFWSNRDYYNEIIINGHVGS